MRCQKLHKKTSEILICTLMLLACLAAPVCPLTAQTVNRSIGPQSNFAINDGDSEQSQTPRDTPRQLVDYFGGVGEGNGDIEREFGGPQTVGAQLFEAESVPPRNYLFPRLGTRYLDPWFEFKDQLSENHGFDLGVDYATLYQSASSSINGQRDAYAGTFRVFSKWHLVGRDSANVGSLVAKGEQRHKIGTDIAPSALGPSVGYLGLTSIGFQDVDWFMPVLYWEQFFNEGRGGFIFGRVDPTDFADISGYANQWRTFQNASILVSSSIAYPDAGIGIGMGHKVGEDFVIGATLHDANGSATNIKFFDKGEFFKQAYVSWSPDGRKERYAKALHLTAWHTDPRVRRGVSESYGVAFSANWIFKNRWSPFFRTGWSTGNGPIANANVNAGIQIVNPDNDDMVGLGWSWQKLSNRSLGQQNTLELLSRKAIAENIEITPSLQILLDPVFANDDAVSLFGIRSRFTF